MGDLLGDILEAVAELFLERWLKFLDNLLHNPSVKIKRLENRAAKIALKILIGFLYGLLTFIPLALLFGIFLLLCHLFTKTR